MPAVRKDRIWFIAGGIAAVLLLAIGWLLLIGPQLSETSSLNDEVDTKQAEVISLRNELRSLREQDRDKQRYLDELAKDRQALPATAATSDSVRQVHAPAVAAGASLTNIAVSDPDKVDGSKPQAYRMDISLTVVGTDPQLELFLDQIQTVQPRAVLINSTTVTAANAADAAGGSSLTVNLQAFVTPEGTMTAGKAVPGASATPTS